MPVSRPERATLLRSPAGLTRTQLEDLLERNQPATRIEQALAALQAQGRAQRQKNTTGGRPAELWRTTQPPAAY